jgi:hypothetical protein
MDRQNIFPENGVAPLRRFHLARHLASVGLFLAAVTMACNFLTSAVGNQIGPLSFIDEPTLNRLEISIGKSGQAQPGDRLELQVGTTECCYVFKPINVNTRWSVDPQTGAKINQKTGVLEIATDVPSGTTFTVTADIQDGRKTLITQIKIYTPQANPLVGVWHETRQIDCQSQAITELQGDGNLRELVFKADGTFQATFTPFEVYHDYWGNYTFDPEKGTLALVVVSGNNIPENLDLLGEYTIDENGTLVFKSLWLGRRDRGTPAGCGQLFAK